MFKDLKQDFLTTLLVDGRRPSTIHTYGTQLKTFEAYLEAHAVTVDDVTPALLRAYLQSLWDAGRYAPSHICLKVRAVKRFFEYLVRSGKLLTNPSEALKEPKLDKKLPRQALAPGTVGQMLEQVNTNSPTGIRNMAILETLLSCGVRHFELMALKVEDVDTKAGMLAAHASQRDWLLKHHGMDQYVESMKRWGAEQGGAHGVAFAEGFRQHLGHSYPQDNLLGRLLGALPGKRGTD